MLIRLLPPSPMPTVLFSLSAPTIPNHLGIPAAYQASLQAVAEQALEQPTSLHSLDHASWPLALLEEVLFDLNTGAIRVVWIDGLHQEWPICPSLHAMLEDVVRNVKKSEAEAERERIQLLTSSPASSPPPLSHLEDSTAPGPGAKDRSKAKTKRQRNLIMNLVASVLSPASPAPSQPSSLPPVPPPAPAPLLNPNQVPNSRLSRRKARSILLDAFRRYIVHELSSHFKALQRGNDPNQKFQPGVPSMSYIMWVTQSMLRRCRERMDMMAKESHSSVPPPLSESADDREDDDCSDASNASIMTPTSDTGLPLPLPSPTLEQSQEQSLIYASLSHLADRLSLLVANLHHSAMLAQCQIEANMAALEQRVARRAKGTMSVDDFEPSTLGMFSTVEDDQGDTSDDDELYDDEEDDDFEEDYEHSSTLPYDDAKTSQWPAQSALPNPHSYSRHQVQHQASIRRPYSLCTGSGTASQLARAVLLRRAFGTHAHPYPYPTPVMEGDGTIEPFDSFPSPISDPPPYSQTDSEVHFDLPVRFAGMEMPDEEDEPHPDDPFAAPYYPEDTPTAFEEHVPEQVYERCSSPTPPEVMSIPSKRHGSAKSRAPLPAEFLTVGIVT